MDELLNPRDYIITRKRKKYKFALFHNSPLCFEYDEWVTARHKKTVVNLQDQTLEWWTPDIVEIGAGNGAFAVELAARHPESLVVALDVKADRLQHGARLAVERGLTNIRFLRARADLVDELFLPHSISEIWVTFPDPFPKKRSAGRRLTHLTFLNKYRDLLAPDGSLRMKHDNRDFFCWSLEQLVSMGWSIVELSFDLHESTLADDYKIQTTYEQKWLKEGLTTQLVSAKYANSSH